MRDNVSKRRSVGRNYGGYDRPRRFCGSRDEGDEDASEGSETVTTGSVES